MRKARPIFPDGQEAEAGASDPVSKVGAARRAGEMAQHLRACTVLAQGQRLLPGPTSGGSPAIQGHPAPLASKGTCSQVAWTLFLSLSLTHTPNEPTNKTVLASFLST